MDHILLPYTDLKISRLSFGTASLHHLPTSKGRQELLAAAIDHGFTHFDTVPYYGFGLSEVEIGKVLQSRSSDISVASKIGLYPPGGTASNMFSVWMRKLGGKFIPSLSKPVVNWFISRATESLEKTLRVLMRDHLDILFLHEPTPGLLNADEFLAWLEKQREIGRIRYWGMAGEINQFEIWIRENHQLAQVLQVRDSLGGTSNQVLTSTGRPLQLTYGYLSAHHGVLDRKTVTTILRQAVLRNNTGSVLVSTRHISSLPELVEAVG